MPLCPFAAQLIVARELIPLPSQAAAAADETDVPADHVDRQPPPASAATSGGTQPAIEAVDDAASDADSDADSDEVATADRDNGQLPQEAQPDVQPATDDLEDSASAVPIETIASTEVTDDAATAVDVDSSDVFPIQSSSSPNESTGALATHHTSFSSVLTHFEQYFHAFILQHLSSYAIADLQIYQQNRVTVHSFRDSLWALLLCCRDGGNSVFMTSSHREFLLSVAVRWIESQFLQLSSPAQDTSSVQSSSTLLTGSPADQQNVTPLLKVMLFRSGSLPCSFHSHSFSCCFCPVSCSYS